MRLLQQPPKTARSTKAKPTPADVGATGCTCARVRRLARRVTQLYDHALAPSGLRVTQFSLMSHLQVHEGLTMAPLAGALDMDRTTLSRNLKPLIALGMVDLSTNSEDGRARVVRLTPEGVRRLRDARRRWRDAQDRVDALLGATQVAALHALFDELIDTFNEDASPKPR